ncbi:hypothetical protein MSKU9_1641 [Komagataeibacter diospyri]|uniref:Uncharacterized protein n=1 Tax=Komagataeibacter diospyri TaxID=1932662 RepID=A0A4P5NPD8_9PROT|nr:hypothetical protein MSKU9_1641 [Komagataeibacter diospyri]
MAENRAEAVNRFREQQAGQAKADGRQANLQQQHRIRMKYRSGKIRITGKRDLVRDVTNAPSMTYHIRED